MARSRKAVAGALSAIISTAMVVATSEVAFAAVPDPDPTTIACTVSTGFLSQGSPTQLYAEQFGSGAIAFNAVGDTSAGVTYNAISVSPANGYIYAVETNPNAGNLLRINPNDATIEDLGATSPALSGYVAGSFDSTGAHYYVSSGNSTSLFDVNVSTAVVTSIPLVGGSTGLADYTVIGDYLWGFKSSAPVRIDPSTGQVTTFAALAGMPTGTYGAAFTLGNGDGEFGNNSGGVTQVHIDDPGSATPTFTVVATSSSNPASTNDGAACVSPATHLSVTADAPTTVAPNGTATWTVTVTNDGPATSSGFTLTDVLPTGYTAGDMSTGCTATGSTVSCTHGSLDVDESATITISATAPNTGSCGSGSVPNTIKVQGNEEDSNPGAGDGMSSPSICVTGDTPQTIDFPQPVDTTLADGPVMLTATTTSGLAVDYTSSTPSVCTVSGDTVALVAAGICTIAADQPGDATYQPAPTIIRSFTIADDGGSTGTIDTQAITFPQPADTDVLSGPVALTATASSGLAVSYASITSGICSVTGSSVTLLAAGTCTIKADQSGNTSYAAASTVTRSFTVVAHGQTVTFAQPATADLADGTVALTATASSGLVVAFTTQTPSVCTVASGTVTLVSAGVCTIRADQPGNSSYSAALPVIRSFDVTDLVGGTTGGVALQTITFPQPPNTDVLAGPITLTATTDAGLPIMYTSLTPSVCTVTDRLVTVVGVGVCTVDADQPGDSTYSAASTIATSFTVAGLPQAITFSQPVTADVTDATVSLAATADSGLGVTYTSSTPTVCTVTGSTVTLLAAGGVCTVKANQPGDATHAAAPTITRSFAITGGTGGSTIATQAITFPAPTASVSGGAVPLTATSDSGLPVSYTSGAPSVCAVAESTLTPTGTGTCVVYADQAGDAFFAAASTASASFAIAAGGGGGAGVPVATTSRLGGADRDATAAQLAMASYPAAGSAHVVVLARDDVYADALTGSPLAVTLDGPVLLTPTTSLSPTTQRAIQSLLPTNGLVVCLGGVNAISSSVVTQLQRLGYQVERIGGADRYATATLIADRVATKHAVGNVYLATGQNFADALPAADAAGLTNGVVLLTAGTQLPGSTRTWLATHSGASLTAIGGSAASATPEATAIVGADRYATAAKVAAALAPEASGIALATGANFPDGLAGAAYAARAGWALLLVSPQATTLDDEQSAYLRGVSSTVRTVTIVGGISALPEGAATLVAGGLGR